MIRITAGDITVNLTGLDLSHLQAGWNTVVSSDGLKVEVHRDEVEAAVADYEAAKQQAQARLDALKAELSEIEEEIAELTEESP